MSREMVDSGFAWMGNIPADWSMTRIQTQLCEINEKNNPVRVSDVLSLTNTRGVIPYEDKGNVGNKSKENVEDYKIAYPDTIVANSMNILIGSVGYCKYYGCVSPVYYVFAPTKCANIHFMDYFMSMTAFQKELRRNANGILEIRMRVSVADILKKKMALPSMDEQRQIVSFLDRKCSAIDTAIEKTKKSIEKLEEYKKAVITKAVTKGLDPNAKMKDSGVEWIGEVPETWDVKRVKHVSTSISKGNGITKDDVVEDGDISCVRYGEIYSQYSLGFDKCVTKTNLSKVSSPQYFSYGDIICAGTGELIEEIGKPIVYLGSELCLAGGDIVVIKHKQNPLYLEYALESACSQGQRSIGKYKLKVVHISASDIGNIRIALPNIEEQNRIVEYLDNKIQSISNVIESKLSTIEKLEEYKKSLIYYAVTGKIDCRNEAV